MGFVLSEEQTMLRETAAQFFSEKLPVANLRKLRDGNDETGFDKAAWKEMADLGFAGLLISEDHGGTDFGPKGLGLIMEQAGRTLAATPLFSTVVLCGSALQLAGSDEQKNRLLPKIASGETVMALALEEGPHHAPFAVATKAEKDGDGFTLSGAKTFVLDGHAADELIVVARTSGKPGDKNGLTLFLVPADAKGLSVTRTIMVDSRNAADVALEGVKVGADAVIGSVDTGGDVLEQVLDIGRIALSAEMLGGIQEVFDFTLDYLKERKQFGELIGSFQALQHRAGEMFCELELCRSVVLDALSALEDRRNDVPQMASLAKAKLTEASKLITNEGVQMHGGVGMTDEYDVGLYLKRARVQAATLGNAAFHRDRYASLEGF